MAHPHQKRLRHTMLAAALAGAGPALALQPAKLTVSRPAEHAGAAGNAANFTGEVDVRVLRAADPYDSPSSALVHFEPGARTVWHTHPAGQTLVVMVGTGYVQRWGGPMEIMRAGDVVWIPPGVKHWHGAAPDVAMDHVAITETRDGRNVDWLEPVDATTP